MNTIIHLKNVSRSISGKKILKNISWRIHKGEQWAVLGENGSGKTTLLNVVSGYLFPSKGRISVLGHEFGTADLREMRKMVGLVSSHLPERVPQSLTCFEVVLSGKYSTFGIYDRFGKKDKSHAKKLLGLLGCSKLAKRNFQELSFGEKQRILIARALMGTPLLPLLDEPTAGLDLKSREVLLRNIEKICRGGKTTVVQVTHRVEEIMPSITHVLMLKNGKILAKGQKGKVLKARNLSRLFGIRVKVEKKQGRFWIRA